MSAMHCIRCGRLILRQERASTIPGSGGVAAWGPKCAAIAGLVKPKRRGPLITARRGRIGAAERAGQMDWIDLQESA